jgi:hypothetical protein
MASGAIPGLCEVGLNTSYSVNRGAIAAMVIAAELERIRNITNPGPINNYSYSFQDALNTIQGEVSQGGGLVTMAGTFTTNSAMTHAIAVSIRVDKISFPAFYYQVTENPVVAVLNQIPYTLEWSINIGTFLQQAPALPSAFNQQGKIFEQKFNLFKQWVQFTFAAQSQQKIVVMQQTVITAPESPGDLIDTGNINVGDIILNPGEVINIGDGGKLFPQFN